MRRVRASSASVRWRSKMSGRSFARVTLAAALIVVARPNLWAQNKPADNYDELYERYLQEARAAQPSTPDAQWAWMTGLTADRRARSLNDLVTIRVVESITGTGTADAALSKNSDASLAVPKLFGLEKKLASSVDPS